jgi:hypothetical protein
MDNRQLFFLNLFVSLFLLLFVAVLFYVAGEKMATPCLYFIGEAFVVWSGMPFPEH